MSATLIFIIRVYSLLLHLYPKVFRDEFEEQMLLDFADMASDASQAGKRSLFFFCLKELIDYPVNLLRVHWKENLIFKLLRSRPVMSAIWMAIGYGMVSFLALPIVDVVSWKLNDPGTGVISYLQVSYFDLFHTEHGLELIALIPSVISSLLYGLMLGVVFAVLLAECSEYPRFILAIMLGWYLHSAVGIVLWQSTNLSFFLGTKHSGYLEIAVSVLSGAFIGLMFVAANSKARWLIRFLTIGAVGYPLVAYLYLQLLFKFSIVETPWLFIGLMVMIVMFIASVVVIMLKSVDGWTGLGMVLSAVIVFQVAPYIIRYIPIQWLSFPELPYIVNYDETAYWQLILRMAIQQGFYGIPFGLILGFIFGLQNKENSKSALT